MQVIGQKVRQGQRFKIEYKQKPRRNVGLSLISVKFFMCITFVIIIVLVQTNYPLVTGCEWDLGAGGSRYLSSTY